MGLPLALTLAACGISGDAAEIMRRIVAVESAGAVHALHVNGGFKLVRQPENHEEARAVASWLLDHGHSFDAGLAQVNSANFARLGLTLETLFDPCTNLRAGLRVFEECRARAEARFGVGERAMVAALSCYNTGAFSRGVRNGYVARVQGRGGGAPGRSADLRQVLLAMKREEVVAAGGCPGVFDARAVDVFAQGNGR